MNTSWLSYECQLHRFLSQLNTSLNLLAELSHFISRLFLSGVIPARGNAAHPRKGERGPGGKCAVCSPFEEWHAGISCGNQQLWGELGQEPTIYIQMLSQTRAKHAGSVQNRKQGELWHHDQQNVLLDIFGRRMLDFPDPSALSQLISIYDTDGNFSGMT